MKCIIIAALILLAGLASAYTPEQQTLLDGMNLSFSLGMAYEKASRGQDVAAYNALADEYNAWVRQHFGEDASLLRPKLNEQPTIAASTATVLNQPMKNPFNTSSELSKFGKQQVFSLPYSASKPTQEDFAQKELQRFLTA